MQDRDRLQDDGATNNNGSCTFVHDNLGTREDRHFDGLYPGQQRRNLFPGSYVQIDATAIEDSRSGSPQLMIDRERYRLCAAKVGVVQKKSELGSAFQLRCDRP